VSHRGALLLLKPAPAVRVRRSTGTDTPIPPDEPAGRNPPDGAVLDYYLASNVTGTLTLEVLDSRGTVVRRVSSTDPPPNSEEELARELIPAYWIRPPRPLGTGAGMHRFVWDLHYASPRTAQRGYPISAVPGDTPREPLGPLAVPGEYRVRLAVGARQSEQPLTIIADPRIKTSAQEFAAQLALQQQLAAALDASTAALFEGRSLQAQLKALAASSGASLRPRIEAMEQRIATLLKPADVENPGTSAASDRGIERLNEDIAGVYAQVGAADAAPTAAQSAAAELALQSWRPLALAWQQLREQELSALNHDLVRARVAPLRVDLPPPRDLDQADEE
jgi:hypothetical protein